MGTGNNKIYPFALCQVRYLLVHFALFKFIAQLMLSHKLFPGLDNIFELFLDLHSQIA